MIYLEPVLQKRALTTFHYSLNEYGYLMLGKSESIGTNTDIFSTYNSAEKIYQRKGPAGRFMNVASYGNEQSFKDADKGAQKENLVQDVFKIADDVILANFMPASVLVNDKFDIVQFRGSTETWLISPSGKPSFNLLKMAREGLSFELRNILHLAKKTGASARKYAVFFKLNGLQHYVNIHAVPIKDMPEPYYLVIFQNASSVGLQQAGIERNPDTDNTNYSEGEMRIEQLEKELMQVRTDMRAITEEQETANEELQSANEELLSGSEELQSLNEELETSKEELQSTNEEIMIVNKELLNRNDQLNDSRLYTEGIVNTIRDPLLILDSELRVRRATGGFYSKFKTTEKETQGHFIYDLGDGQWDIPKLRDLLEQILPSNKVTHDFEVDHIFPNIGRKIMCLNARQIDNINGGKLILMAIEDITEKRTVEIGLAEAERMLSESKERLKFAVESAGLGTWDYNPKTRELVWDKRCREIYGFTPTKKVDISAFFNVIHPDDKDFVESRIKETFTAKGLGEFDVEYRSAPIGGKIKWLKGKGRAYFNDQGEPVRFIGTLLDITLQKVADEATRELLAQKDEFISVASHELKTPITSLKAALQIIERASAKGDSIKAVDGFIQKALKQVDKLTELIRDLLDVTKIQSGKLSLRKTKFYLDELITECVEDQQNSTKTHRLVVEGAARVAVNADRNRIEQVLVNLISNAIKYSPDADKVIITITESDHVAKVAVTDFGIGMPKDKLPLIFDRFYRVDDNSQSYAGLGLGLYISAEIVQRHGGHISIESTLGKGSTIWFIIPV
jgi:two-component system CheB/CheR fusion protein